MIGVVVTGGIAVAALLTLFVVPGFYILLARYAKPIGAVAHRIEELEEDHAQ